MQELQKSNTDYKFITLDGKDEEVPADWESSPLSKIGTLHDGDWILEKDYAVDGVRLLQVGDIGIGKFIGKSSRYISIDSAQKLKCTFVKQGNDILISRMPDPIGRACLSPILPYPYIVAVDITIYSVNKKFSSPNFLVFPLNYKTFFDQVQQYVSGTTRQRISRKRLEDITLLLPPLNEQQKITSILSRVDELIQKADQIIEQTQRLKNGLMQKLLVEGIGHRRYKSVRFGPHFLDHDIPDKWQVLTLKQCVRNDTPITYGIVQAGPHVPDGIPYIRTGDMSGDKLSINDMLRTSNEIASSFRRSQVKAGEIVCALRGIVGKVLEVPEELEGANLTQGTARISPRHDIECQCLLWALQSEYTRRQFEIFSKGTTLNEITLEQLRTIKVAIPSDIQEQKDLAHILDQLELAIGLRLRYKEKVVMLKAGLMQKLLTGKIRVKV